MHTLKHTDTYRHTHTNTHTHTELTNRNLALKDDQTDFGPLADGV